TCRDAIEYRLYVCWRPADHSYDIARRCLLFKGLTDLRMGLRERPILLLQLLEQPHILDRDDRLIGKRLEQFDLDFGKRSGLGACHGNRARRLTIAEHWHLKERSPTPCSRDFALPWPGCRFAFHIRDMVQRSCDDGSI